MITHILGIDEAGRGPLAGPVSIGVVKVHKDYEKKIQRLVKEIKGKDSKKLSHTNREIWFEKIKEFKKEKKLDFHVALISEKIIDTKGLSFAIKLGMKKCLIKLGIGDLKNSNKRIKCEECFIKLDGSLKAPKEFLNQKTIIKGDEKEWIIGLASICAKVTRDRYIVKLSKDKKYSMYKLDIHKGYGTKLHRELISKYGPSKVHRRSFLRFLTK